MNENKHQNKCPLEVDLRGSIHCRSHWLQNLTRIFIVLGSILLIILLSIGFNRQTGYATSNASHPPTSTPTLSLGGLNPFGSSKVPVFPTQPPLIECLIASPAWLINTTSIDLRTRNHPTEQFVSDNSQELSVIHCPQNQPIESSSFIDISPHLLDIVLSGSAEPNQILPSETPFDNILAIATPQPPIEAVSPTARFTPTDTLAVVLTDALKNKIEQASKDLIALHPLQPQLPMETLLLETELRVTLTKPNGDSVFFTESNSVAKRWSFKFDPDAESGNYVVKVISGDCAIECIELFSEAVSVIGQTRIVMDAPNASLDDQFSNNIFRSPQDVEIQYQDFRERSMVNVAIYRVVADLGETIERFFTIRDALVPIDTQKIQIRADGNFTQPLTSLLSVDNNDVVAGQYIILTCYTLQCDRLPHIEFDTLIRSTDAFWPNLYYTTFTIGTGSSSFGFVPIDAEFTEIGRNSLDPIVRTELVFQVEVSSLNRGSNIGPVSDFTGLAPLIDLNDTNVTSIDFRIRNSSGVEVHHMSDKSSAYCAFGDRTSCRAWEFGHNGNRWPDGRPIESGIHTLHATIHTTGGLETSIEQAIRIELPELEVSITQTGPNSASSLISERLIFQVEAYDPAQGDVDGSGIENVQLTVIDPDGKTMEEKTLDTAPYCLHLDDENQCIAGEALTPGFYIIRSVVTAENGRVKQVQRSIQINPAIFTPVQTARAFYEAIDAGVLTGDYRPAYDLLSNARHAGGSFSSFEAGFVTTRAVKVELVELVSQDEENAQVHIVIIATDEIDGELSSVRYDINYQLIFEDERWRLDTARVDPL